MQVISRDIFILPVSHDEIVLYVSAASLQMHPTIHQNNVQMCVSTAVRNYPKIIFCRS